MSALPRLLLCAALVVLMLAAGCSSQSAQKSGSGALVTATGANDPSASPAANGGSSGTCGAVDFDPANCGKCGAVCPENAVCSGGNCYCKDGYKPDSNQCVALPAGTTNGCPKGMSPCGKTFCYELQSDRSNCGVCGLICPSGKVCSAGACVGAYVEPTSTAVAPQATCGVPGQTKCGSRCANLSSSSANCGSCGSMCQSRTPNCCSGACVDFSKDESNCGSCGHVCPAGSECSLGSCRMKVTGIVYSSVTVAPSFVK